MRMVRRDTGLEILIYGHKCGVARVTSASQMGSITPRRAVGVEPPRSFFFHVLPVRCVLMVDHIPNRNRLTNGRLQKSKFYIRLIDQCRILAQVTLLDSATHSLLSYIGAPDTSGSCWKHLTICIK